MPMANYEAMPLHVASVGCQAQRFLNAVQGSRALTQSPQAPPLRRHQGSQSEADKPQLGQRPTYPSFLASSVGARALQGSLEEPFSCALSCSHRCSTCRATQLTNPKASCEVLGQRTHLAMGLPFFCEGAPLGLMRLARRFEVSITVEISDVAPVKFH